MALYPVGAADIVGFTSGLPRYPTGTTDANLYTLVDEVTADGWSTYIHTNTAPSSMQYQVGFTYSGSPLGIINTVTPYVTHMLLNGTAHGSTGTFSLRVSYGGWSNCSGGQENLYSYYDAWRTQSFDSTGFVSYASSYKWEWAHFSSMYIQADFAACSTGQCAITQMYCIVDYSPFTIYISDISLTFTEVIAAKTATASDTTHNQSSDNLTLVPGQLIMDDAYHIQALDGDISLILSNPTLTMDEAYHTQDSAHLLFNIAVQDLESIAAEHLQYTDNIELVVESVPTDGTLDEDLPFLEFAAFTGATGDIELPGVTIDAGATAAPLVRGELIIPVITLTGNSGYAISFTLPAMALGGISWVGEVASADLQLPGVSATAVGSVSVGGNASLLLSALTLEGTGIVTPIGSVSASLPVFGIDASGVVGVVGDVDLVIPVITIAGTSYFDVSGAMTETFPFPEIVFTASNKSRFTGYILRWIR